MTSNDSVSGIGAIKISRVDGGIHIFIVVATLKEDLLNVDRSQKQRHAQVQGGGEVIVVGIFKS
jgi:hypothetical protein